MRRAAPTVPITPAMLRHFAAITLVATICLAVFANGENKAAMASGTKGNTPAESGGGAMNAMFGGAEEAALKKSREDGGKREVNGLKIGGGTRLENNSVEPEDVQADHSTPSDGNIDNLNDWQREEGKIAAMPRAPAGPGAGPAGPPAPLARDANGVPIPPHLRLGPGGPRTQPGRKPPTTATAGLPGASSARPWRGQE